MDITTSRSKVSAYDLTKAQRKCDDLSACLLELKN